MPHYRILSGTFREPDDTVKGPGDTIEMGADVAARHTLQLEQLPEPDTAERPADQAQANPA